MRMNSNCLLSWRDQFVAVPPHPTFHGVRTGADEMQHRTWVGDRPVRILADRGAAYPQSTVQLLGRRTVEGRGANSDGWILHKFVQQVLAALPGVSELQIGGRRPAHGDVAVDFIARFEGRPLLVEVKLETPQTSRRLRQPVQQLLFSWQAYQEQYGAQDAPRLVVAFPGILSPERQDLIADVPHLEVWDGPVLRRLARTVGVASPDFLAVGEEELTPSAGEPADELIARLDAIPIGKPGSAAFERFVEDLLNLLFVPPLNPVIAQSSNENNVNRRDFILPNYAAADTFWGFLRTHYRGDFIVAEAKNYEKPVGKNEVLQLANYLSHHGTGLVGLILTRNGLHYSGRWTSREQWLLHSKLIIGLRDDDYRQMLLTKRAGGDPADLVRERIEDFRLKI